MEFLVSIDKFEGPLDLMLSLVKENKLDIFDLDLNVLADQYIKYIRAMQKDKILVASEYLAELADLVEYKSRKLLPRNDAVLEANYEEDQREKLMSRLQEYQRYKDAAKELEKSYIQREKRFGRDMASTALEWSVPKEVDDYSSLNPYSLIKAMEKVLKRQVLAQPYQTSLKVKEISIEERCSQLEGILLGKNEICTYEELLDDCVSLHEAIVTFLALLAMASQGKVHLYQDEFHIYVQKKGNADHGES